MPTQKITKNSANTVVLTLTEKTALAPVFYLLEVTNVQTEVSVYCILTEISTELQRYNEFIVNETPVPTPLNGDISLSTGQYTYQVYEQSNGTNLSPTGLTMVENGILKCFQTNTINTEYPNAVTTNTVYE